MHRGEKLSQFSNLVSFLKTLEKHMLLEQDCKHNKVIYADDQFANLHTVQRNFEELNIAEKLITFSNGQDVIDYFEGTLKCITQEDLQHSKLPL